MDQASDDDITPVNASIQHVNAQLIERGFVSRPGLPLDNVSPADVDIIVKCLLSMLNQRVRDMTTTEDLSTKVRTLTYDNGRLQKMLENAEEVAANAEREMNLHKAKCKSVEATLKSRELAHRQTMQDLQKSKTALQAVRTLHTTELKKRDGQMEKMSERWLKLADTQFKTTASISLRGSHANTANIQQDDSIWQKALNEAEDARTRLAQETVQLRGFVLTAINELASAASQASLINGEQLEISTNGLSASTLSADPDAVQTDLIKISTSLRQQIDSLSKWQAGPSSSTRHTPEPMPEIQQTTTLEDQDVLEQERRKLRDIQSDIAQERDRLVDLAAQVESERISLEASRMQLNEERRAWEEERMEMEPTTSSTRASTDEMIDHIPPPTMSPKVLRKASLRSPSQSPRSRRKTKGRSQRSRGSFEPSFETEVIPKSLLKTQFVLPPPSPQALFAPSESFPPTQTSPSKLFPVAKPLAPRMIHAYSPVRPSPLSRILGLGAVSPNSNPSSTPLTLDALRDDDDDDVFGKSQDAPVLPEAQFGATSPLRDRGNKKDLFKASKVKAKPNVSSIRAVKEKENIAKAQSMPLVRPQPALKVEDLGPLPREAKTTRVFSKKVAPVATSLPSKSKSVGPRRVPVNSAEAAPRNQPRKS